MDIISYSQGKKAKKQVNKLNQHLGRTNEYKHGDQDIKDTYNTVDERITEMEQETAPGKLNKKISELSANTMINLNKHNLKVDSLLNATRYKHKNMVFDTFADDSGIDPDKSSGYLLDSTNQKIVIDSNQTEADVVTFAEELDSVPQNIVVSQSFNEQNTDSEKVNLVNGVLNGTEIINGELKLKSIATTTKISDINVAFNKTTTASSTYGDSGGYASSKGAVDGNTTANSYKNWWALNNRESSITPNPGWWKVDLGSNFMLKKFRIYTGITTNKKLPHFTIAISIDDETYTDIYSGSAISGWNDIILDYAKEGRYIKVYKFDTNGYGYKVSTISEFEAYEEININKYDKNGFYETPIINLGDNFKSLSKIDISDVIPNDTMVKIYTATSNDGISFTNYIALNPDYTIASPSAPYIKVKLELIGYGENNDRTIYYFDEEENNRFQKNENIILDGTAKLKTQYTYELEVDNDFTESGTLLKKAIEKSKFKSIESLEVL